ncbi:MAG: hypothetical protein JXA13_10815 [Anaerolineales bacterium]|nr:hypothetical protein [Anaerolineales bacterium]
MPRVISIVQCVKMKRDTPQLARHLYISPLFVNAAAYAEKISDEWYILSAKYHLARPLDWLEPYDLTLKNMTARQRREWAERVFAELKPLLKSTDTVVMLAGVLYRKNLVKKIEGLGCSLQIPMRGLGIGKQVQWLKKQLEEC